MTRTISRSSEESASKKPYLPNHSYRVTCQTLFCEGVRIIGGFLIMVVMTVNKIIMISTYRPEGKVIFVSNRYTILIRWVQSALLSWYLIISGGMLYRYLRSDTIHLVVQNYKKQLYFKLEFFQH